MIAVLKHGVTKAQQDNLIHWLEAQNVRVHVSEGEMQTVIGLIGDTRKIDIDLLAGLEIIDRVTPIRPITVCISPSETCTLTF